MKKSVKQKVLNRLDAGEEPAQIVAKFSSEASQATIYRLIKEYEKKNESLNGTEDDEDYEDGDEYGALRGAEVDYEDDETARTGYDESDKSGFSETDKTALEGKKRKIVKNFKKTLKTLTMHASGHEWKPKHLKKMVNELDGIQDDIEELLNFESDLYEKNAFWVILDDLIDDFQSYAGAGGTVEIELAEDEKDTLNNALELNDFDQEFDWEGDFKNRYNRFYQILLNNDEEKLDSDEIEELRYETDRILTTMANYDLNSTFEGARDSIRDVDRDFKSLQVRADNSLFGNVKFELDEGFFIFEN